MTGLAVLAGVFPLTALAGLCLWWLARKAGQVIAVALRAGNTALNDCAVNDDLMSLADAIYGIHRTDCECTNCIAFGRVLHQAGEVTR
jgi:hypothetical protein